MTRFFRDYPTKRKLRIGAYSEITEEKLVIFRESFIHKYLDLRNSLTISGQCELVDRISDQSSCLLSELSVPYLKLLRYMEITSMS